MKSELHVALTYDEIANTYKQHGLVDITPENCKYKSTRHFLDTRLSDPLGLNGPKMRVYYVFSPETGEFRRRIDTIRPLSNGKNWRQASAYPLNRTKTLTYNGRRYREIMLEHDITKQMYLASSAIDSYRRARGVETE
jgi:hypothetical protein